MRLRLLLAAAVVVGVSAAPAAVANHSCARPLNQICALTCRPVEIWC